MDFTILSHLGVGPLRFGMKPAEIRALIRSRSEITDKASSKTPSDYFIRMGIFAYYNDHGHCHAIEFFGPVPPTFHGRPVLGRPYNEYEAWIRTMDPDLEPNGAGFTAHLCGIGVYAPAARNHPKDPIEAVIAFDKHYW